jgi:hypothetical protein
MPIGASWTKSSMNKISRQKVEGQGIAAELKNIFRLIELCFQERPLFTQAIKELAALRHR